MLEHTTLQHSRLFLIPIRIDLRAEATSILTVNRGFWHSAHTLIVCPVPYSRPDDDPLTNILVQHCAAVGTYRVGRVEAQPVADATR